MVKPDHNQSSTDLTTLVLRRVSRLSFADWILAKSKLKDFVPPTFKLLKVILIQWNIFPISTKDDFGKQE